VSVVFIPRIAKMMTELEFWRKAWDALAANDAFALESRSWVEAPRFVVEFLPAISRRIEHNGVKVHLSVMLVAQDEPRGKPWQDLSGVREVQFRERSLHLARLHARNHEIQIVVGPGFLLEKCVDPGSAELDSSANLPAGQGNTRDRFEVARAMTLAPGVVPGAAVSAKSIESVPVVASEIQHNPRLEISRSRLIERALCRVVPGQRVGDAPAHPASHRTHKRNRSKPRTYHSNLPGGMAKRQAAPVEHTRDPVILHQKVRGVEISVAKHSLLWGRGRMGLEPGEGRLEGGLAIAGDPRTQALELAFHE